MKTLALSFLTMTFVATQGTALGQAGNSGSHSSIPSLESLAGKWMETSTLLALPTINSGDGSAEAANGILAVGNLSYPPITMTGETGTMLIGGRAPSLEETRWYPYQVLRRGRQVNIAIETSVRMVYSQRGLLFHIVLVNDGKTVQNFNLAINLTVNTSEHSKWGWQVPRPNEPDRFSAVETDNGRTLFLKDSKGQLANCFSFATKPGQLAAGAHSGRALWNFSLRPGQKTVIDYVLAIGYKDQAVHELAVKWADNFDATYKQVQTDWQARFDAMFTPHNKFFSGYLPALVTADKDLSRMYYMSVVSLLSILRTGFPVAPRVYVSNSPQSNCTMVYFWDTSEWANTLALLDPAMLRRYLESWLSKGIYDGYAEEYLTGSLEGPWYSANDLSIFRLINAYLNVTGDRSFLDDKIAGKTVLQYMVEIADHWKTLVRPGRTLADYGGASNLLECVPTYVNEVASLNAVNVRIMRRVAAIEDEDGNAAEARQLRAGADSLFAAVVKLYVPKEGIWDTIHRNGKRVPVSSVFDFATVGLTIGRDLSPGMRNGMLHFVESKLVTDHWMRALSLTDPAASASNRPDHGPMGAFCSWPAETMRVMCYFGKYEMALGFLHHCTEVTYEGPFSQSRELLSRSDDAAVQISPAPQTYNASNGGSFAETIIRGFFGFRPNFLNGKLIPDKGPRGFEGELLNVHQGSRVFDIISSRTGIRVKAAGSE